MSVLLTRPAEDSARIAVRLAEQGIESFIWPLSRIEVLEGAVVLPESIQAIVLTSANAAAALRGLDSAMPVLCVGPRTSSAARQAGARDVREAGGDVASLAVQVQRLGLRSVFYPRGETVSQDLVRLLEPLGCAAHEQIVYRSTSAGPPDSRVQMALETGRIALVTIWSRRNGEILSDYLSSGPAWPLSAMDLIGISANALEPLAMSGFRRAIPANSPDADGMIGTISAALRQ